MAELCKIAKHSFSRTWCRLINYKCKLESTDWSVYDLLNTLTARFDRTNSSELRTKPKTIVNGDRNPVIPRKTDLVMLKTSSSAIIEDVSNGQRSTFFKLPRKIRDEISWFALVHNDKRVAVPGPQTVNFNCCNIHVHGFWITRDKEPALLSTCRLIRIEALPEYYKNNDFVVCITNFEMQPLLNWLKQLSFPAVASIRSLTIWLYGHSGWSNPTRLLQAAEEVSLSVDKISFQGHWHFAKIYGLAINHVKTVRALGLD